MKVIILYNKVVLIINQIISSVILIKQTVRKYVVIFMFLRELNYSTVFFYKC